MTFRIQVQCYNHSKPTGNWSFNWFVIYREKIKMKKWIYKINFSLYFIAELNCHFSLSIFFRQFILSAWEFTYSGLCVVENKLMTTVATLTISESWLLYLERTSFLNFSAFSSFLSWACKENVRRVKWIPTLKNLMTIIIQT